MSKEPSIPLIECPFCGGQPGGFGRCANGHHFVACPECLASSNHLTDGDKYTESEAAAAWNTRADATPGREGLIEKMNALKMERSLTLRASAAIDDCIAIIRQHQAEQKWQTKDGSPIFGEGSPHNVRDRVEKVCGSEKSGVVEAIENRVYHEAQDSEFDTGFNEAKRQAVAVAMRYSKPVMVELEPAVTVLTNIQDVYDADLAEKQAKLCAEAWGLSWT